MERGCLCSAIDSLPCSVSPLCFVRVIKHSLDAREKLAMSYGLLHHDNRSSRAIGQLGSSPSPPNRPESDTEDEVDIDLAPGDGEDNDFELKDLSHIRNNNRHRGLFFDHESQELGSDGEKDARYGNSRRASASTVQSFMLYTPDEERSVIKKLDRRLVLFVALLYMLSFLDRSSTSCSRLSRPVLSVVQILGMPALLACRTIFD